jgi:hypothetical protein
MKTIFTTILFLSLLTTVLGQNASGDGGATLPFRLHYFSARVINNNEVTISFTNAETYTVVTHYEILRSLNNVDFVTIGSVLQTNSSPTGNNYQFLDNLQNTTTTETVYYKLKQVTRNNEYTYSTILAVKLNKPKTANVTIWPVPTVDELNIQLDNNVTGKIFLTFLNNTGQIIGQETMVTGKGSTTFKTTKVANWQKGTYILQIKFSDDTFVTKSFLKK